MNTLPSVRVKLSSKKLREKILKMMLKAAVVTNVTTADVARNSQKKSCEKNFENHAKSRRCHMCDNGGCSSNNLKKSCNFKTENQSKILSHLTQEKTSCNTENVTVTASNSGHTPVPIKDTTARLGVTAVIAIMEPATESQSSRAHKQPLRSRPSNKIRVLLDSGSDGDLYFLPKGKDKSFPYLTRQAPKSWRTSNGSFQTHGRGKFRLKFFEYSASREYTIQPDIVEYDENHMTEPGFDLILGCNSMNELGIVLDFRTKEITLDEISLPMRDINNLRSRSAADKAWKVNNSIYQSTSTEPQSTLEATKRLVEILDAKYEKANLRAITEADCLNHLSATERNKLLQLLQEFEELFDGTLGDWDCNPVSLQLKEGAQPYHGRSFPIPKKHVETLKKEIQRLCDLGVLKWQEGSEWASPTFIIPKKDNTVRVISDFREVNKRIVRKPFPLPKISTVLQELEGFTYATALDLNMGYYTIRLDPDASKICTIILPWGKYSYLRLPMGIACSPDIFQAKMSELMGTLEFVRTYIDDLLCITKGNLDDHLNKLRRVLIRLRDAGLKVNASKSSFCATETEYLGYVLSRDGIKPQQKKVRAILALMPPKSVKELRRFLGMVQYYRDIWARRSEMLAPLTNLVGECGHTKVTKAKKTKKVPWHWDKVHQQAFDNVKAIITRDVTLAYPDYTQGFEIYTDSSRLQLGAVITQNNRPLAFFSRKLSPAQQKYSVTEQELLAIVETLKEFKGMLWGQQITVYTDHKNLMQDALGLTSDRVYRWRLLLEEYGPTIVYIKGIHNTVADAISRLDYGPVQEDKSTMMTFAQCWCHYTSCQEESTANMQESMNLVFANRDDEDAIYPLTTREIANAQQHDADLNAIADKHGYTKQLVENTEVLCKDGRMVIPKSLQHRAVAWYHHYLLHPGTTRLEETIRLSMYWKGLRKTVQSHVKKCHSCQVNKRRNHKYGKLPAKLAITTPWEALCVDLIGPYTLKGKDGTVIDFMCVTMIDPATSWFEIVELPISQPVLDIPMGTKGRRGKDTHIQQKEPYFDKSSATVSTLVNRTWFCRYPRSQYIIYDNGSEFKLHFETLCETYGLTRKPTTIKNPQANAILE